MELRRIDFGNMGQIAGLSVREEQRGSVASNMGSLAAAFVAVSNGFAENGEMCGEEIVAVREL